MANRDDVLVTTEWLAEHLNDPGTRIVEVDEDTDAYGRGHIPGAVAVNWNTDLQDPLRRDFIDPEQFAKLQSSLGIAPSTLVVLYGGNNNWFAAYAYWYYKVYGHGPAKLLDGGRKSWELEGRELARGVPGREDGSRPPAPGGGAATRPHPRGGEHPLGQGGRRHHRQVPQQRRPARAVRRPGRGARPGRGGLLPHRRALGAHLVRAPRAARLPERPQLRRLLDRVGIAGRGPDRALTAQPRRAVGARPRPTRPGPLRP